MTKMTLMEHQKQCVERYEHESVIPLFHDCGTGKSLTSSAIATRKYQNGDIDCVLVIAPNGLDEQWAFQELPLYIKEEFLPADTVVLGGRGFKGDTLPIPYLPGRLHFVCVNIDKFSTPKGYLRYVDWVNNHNSMIIVDEATVIKNSAAARTQRLLYSFNDVVRRGKTILKSVPRTKARALLTGTPVTEAPFDIWSMFEFLQPGYFGLNEYAFCNKFGMYRAMDARGRVIRILINRDIWYAIKSCTSFEQAQLLFGITLDTYETIRQQTQYEGPYKHLNILRNYIHQQASFVRITDIREMPDQIMIKREIEMTPAHLKVYQDLTRAMIAKYNGVTITAATKLTLLLRQAQVSSGFMVPSPADDEQEGLLDWDEDPNPQTIIWIEKQPRKMEKLLYDMEEMAGEQMIVLCQFSAEAEKLFELISQSYNTCLITGYRTVGTVADFQAGKHQVLVGTIKKMARGYNLQNAYNLLYYSSSFSCEDRIQSMARIWRTGQTHKCRYFDYINKGTVDEKIFSTLKAKKEISDYITSPITTEELLSPQMTGIW